MFTAPGHTSSCHRCVLRSRYEAFEAGYAGTVTSHGTPLHATDRLNASKSMITMALLHALHPDADAEHPATARYQALFEQIKGRNLMQMRLDPFIADSLGLHVFDNVFAGADQQRVVCDEAVWLPQDPEDGSEGRPVCGDCGGGGDLLSMMGETIAPLEVPEDRQDNAA